MSKECLGCLECCRWAGFNTQWKKRDLIKPRTAKILNEAIQFWKTRGFKIAYEGPEESLWVFIPTNCPYLTDKGCSIYMNRPEVCKWYNGHNDPFMHIRNCCAEAGYFHEKPE